MPEGRPHPAPAGPEPTGPAAPDESAQPARPAAGDRRRWITLALMCSGLLLVALDSTVLNVALPALAADLAPSGTQLLWIVDIYSLVVAGLLVSAGTLSDRIGRKRMFIAGMTVFGLASLLAASATSTEFLIACRVLRGVGGAMIMPATLSVIRNVFTDSRERATAIGIWSATASAGSAIGPILAGLLLQRFWWGSVFLLAIPIVVVAVALAVPLVPESRDPNPGRLDVPSVLLSVTGMIALVYGIKEIAVRGPADPAALAFTLAGLAVIVAFVRRQRRLADPLLDVSLFGTRRFTAAALAVMLSFFGFFGLLFFITQYFQIVRGMSPMETGLLLLPLALASAVAAPLTGAIVRGVGTRATLAGGFVLVAVSLAGFALLGASSNDLVVGIGLAGVGFGASLTVTAGSQAIMVSAPAHRAGGAAAIQETSFELGSGLGVALLGSVMAVAYSRALPEVPGVSGPDLETARESLPAAAGVAEGLGATGDALAAAAQSAFFSGFGVTALTGAAIMLATAVAAALFLPGRAREREEAATAVDTGW
ncbi:MFS transporter [Streptosporangium fragile]|uniref:MFS transporter n=1 Tax=Streptosporangium fragile TaxID=46186 RepID=A0ABP6IR89_9ACTN